MIAVGWIVGGNSSAPGDTISLGVPVEPPLATIFTGLGTARGGRSTGSGGAVISCGVIVAPASGSPITTRGAASSITLPRSASGIR